MEPINPLAPAVQDFVIDRNTDFETEFWFTLDDEVTLVDMTGWTFTMKIRQDVSVTSDQVFVVTLGDLFGTPPGKITASITTASMEPVASGTYYFKLIGTKSGKSRTWFKGSFKIED